MGERTCIPCSHPCRSHIGIPHKELILSGSSIVASAAVVESRAAGQRLVGKALHFDYLDFVIIYLFRSVAGVQRLARFVVLAGEELDFADRTTSSLDP